MVKLSMACFGHITFHCSLLWYFDRASVHSLHSATGVDTSFWGWWQGQDGLLQYGLYRDAVPNGGPLVTAFTSLGSARKHFSQQLPFSWGSLWSVSFIIALGYVVPLVVALW